MTTPQSAPGQPDDSAASRGPASQPLLSVRVQRGDGRLTINLEGELDLSTAPQIHEVLLEAASDENPDRLILDLSALSFVDSTGLSLLVVTNKRMNGLGRVLVLQGAQPIVRRLLEVTGLIDVFRMED